MDSFSERSDRPLDARDASRIGRAIEANDPMAQDEDVLVAESSELDAMDVSRSATLTPLRKGGMVWMVGGGFALVLVALVLWAILGIG